MWSIMTGVRSHVEMQRKKFQCRQNDLPDWQAGQSISQSSQSVDRSVAVSSSFRERSLDRGQLLSSLSLSLGRWRQIYAWRDRFINWCAHCRRTSCCCCCCPCPVSPAPNWRQLRRRRTLRAVARLGGYFLIDIEMIYVCCLMSSHTQTQADGQRDGQTNGETETVGQTVGQIGSFPFTQLLLLLLFWAPSLHQVGGNLRLSISDMMRQNVAASSTRLPPSFHLSLSLSFHLLLH